MSAIQSALSGMHAAETQLNRTASNIARLPASASAAKDGDGDSDGDTVDLSADMVNLLQARNDFAANAKVAHVADQIQQSTINILA